MITTEDAHVAMVMLVSLLISSLISLAFYLVQAWANSRLFIRAGEKGWKAYVPFYNSFIKHKIAFGEKNQWFWFISLFVNLYLLYTYFAYARSYGRSVGYCVFALFFPWISDLVMALSDDHYQGPRQHVFQTL